MLPGYLCRNHMKYLELLKVWLYEMHRATSDWVSINSTRCEVSTTRKETNEITNSYQPLLLLLQFWGNNLYYKRIWELFFTFHDLLLIKDFITKNGYGRKYSIFWIIFYKPLWLGNIYECFGIEEFIILPLFVYRKYRSFYYFAIRLALYILEW